MPQPTENAVLIVSASPQGGRTLSNLLHDVPLKVLRSRDCRQAYKRIAASGISVVICESALPDGDWRDVLLHVSQPQSSSVLIVTSKVADESLWAEVLNLGGYDVLAQPFDREEVTRVVASAIRASAEERVHQ